MDVDFDSAAALGLPRYVRSVTAALGLDGDSSFVQLGPPAHAYIAVDDRLLLPGRDLALLWDEENGWALGAEPRSGVDLIVLGYLCDDVLPLPDAVARAVRRAVADPSALRQDPPAHRTAADVDELPARLAGYARSDAGRWHRWTPPRANTVA